MITFRPSQGFGYLPDAISKFAEEFNFVGVPDVKTMLPTAQNPIGSPAIFQHGKLELSNRTIVVDELQVYQYGFIVSARTSTHDTDQIAEQIMLWALSNLNFTTEPLKPAAHWSQLEIEFVRPLPELIPTSMPVALAITQALEDFWDIRPTYELTSLSFAFDPLKASKVAPSAFRIERRVDVPYEMNLYFCEAPLSTDQTLDVVTRFERACLEALR